MSRQRSGRSHRGTLRDRGYRATSGRSVDPQVKRRPSCRGSSLNANRGRQKRGMVGLLQRGPAAGWRYGLINSLRCSSRSGCRRPDSLRNEDDGTSDGHFAPEFAPPPAPLAQWQSSGLLTRWFRVRPPGGALRVPVRWRNVAGCCHDHFNSQPSRLS